MHGALRVALRQCRPAPRPLLLAINPTCTALTSRLGPPQARPYASKAKGGKGKDKDKDKDKKAGLPDRDKSWRGHSTGTDALVPGSQQALSGELQAEYDRAKAKMQSAVDWFRREAAVMETQGSGRVTPDILKPVRVALPNMPEGETCALAEVATVGVRDGTTLLVTVFAEDSLKHVEKAIYAAHIPHVVPQKTDNRTIKIPMPKPTVDARVELAKSAAKLAEDARVQLRRIEQTSVKKGNYKKHSLEMDEFHELLQKYLKDVDSVVVDVKKNLGVK